MEQKKIEHITLNLIVFGTIVIIGVLARQTALHYGWDEFSSYLILVVCSIVIGAIYFNLQMIFGQILAPIIEKCFVRFECYRNKTIEIEEYREPIEDAVDVEQIIPESQIEVETTSDTSEEISTPLLSESNEGVAKLQKEDATPSIIVILLLKNPPNRQNMRCFVPMRWQRKSVHPRKDLIKFSHTRNGL